MRCWADIHSRSDSEREREKRERWCVCGVDEVVECGQSYPRHQSTHLTILTLTGPGRWSTAHWLTDRASVHLYDLGLAWSTGPSRHHPASATQRPDDGRTAAKWNWPSLVIRPAALSECHRASGAPAGSLFISDLDARYELDDELSWPQWTDSANIEINGARQNDRVRPGDWSFGIHGQSDKTVCLMTYWHVDRHFSSCGARRACRPGSTPPRAIWPSHQSVLHYRIAP